MKIFESNKNLVLTLALATVLVQPATPQNSRVDSLLNGMSIDEKVAHMNTSPAGLKSYRQNPDNKYNLPGFVSCDGPRGMKIGGTGIVNFPASLTVAATWNDHLSEAEGRAFADQLIQLKSNQGFAPGLNIIRHPLAGRNAEYYSEDQILSGKMAAANIRGLQYNGCIATPKHFAVNSFEIGRFRIDVSLPENVLREIYLPAFRIAVDEGNPWSIMTAYNQVNGHYLSANKHLLDILNNEWHFKGYVVSDYGAELESAPAALEAGTHVEMPGWQWYTAPNIKKGLADGSIQKNTFDNRVRKILEIKTAPWFRDPAKMPDFKVNLDEQRALVRKIATEGAVLLKNDGNLLPISKDKTVALIGPFADGDLMKGSQGSSICNTAYTASPLKVLTERFGSKITYVKGCEATEDLDAPQTIAWPCKAEYFDNTDLAGKPVIVRNESEIQKLSFTGSGSAVITKGIKGNGFQFNGQSSLSIGNSPEVAENRDFTWSFWTYLPDQFPDKDGGLLSAYFFRNNEFTITPKYLNWSLFPVRANLRLNFEIPDQNWTHVAIVRHDGLLKVYLNAKEVASAKFPHKLPAAPMAAGGSMANDKNANCIIDEINFYDTALNPQQLEMAVQKKHIDTKPVWAQNCETINKAKANAETYDALSNPNKLSARWTTNFTPAKTGKYLFKALTNGGVRMYIDGVKMVDQWQEAWVEGQNRRVWADLQAGKTYKITLEFANWYAANRGKGGFIKFGYQMPEHNQAQTIAEAVSVAKNSDVAIVAVGVPGLYQGESNDLDHFQLPAYQDELVQAVSAANPNTVVVLFTAGGVDMNRWIAKTPAVLEMFFPGEEGGNALADLIYGDANPSGKLPVSYTKNLSDLLVEPVQKTYETSLAAFGYRYFDSTGKKPLFAFGHGLSYTTFMLNGLKLSQTAEGITATVTVTNTGKKTGAEVVQIYTQPIKTTVQTNYKELGGYAKVQLEPGESRTVTILLEPEAFSYFGVSENRWITDKGVYKIMAGNASDNILTQTEWTLK